MLFAFLALAAPVPPTLDVPSSPVSRVTLDTAEGQVELEIHREWAPRAADRFVGLVRAGFFDGVKVFRAVDGFMVQFGISGDPRVSAQYGGASFPDEDPADQKEKQSNARGMVSFASAGPNTRSTQVFINTVDNTYLDDMGFAPFARVVNGLPVVDRFVTEYGEDPMAHTASIEREGNVFLERRFPRLTTIRSAKLDEAAAPQQQSSTPTPQQPPTPTPAAAGDALWAQGEPRALQPPTQPPPTQQPSSLAVLAQQVLMSQQPRQAAPAAAATSAAQPPPAGVRFDRATGAPINVAGAAPAQQAAAPQQAPAPAAGATLHSGLQRAAAAEVGSPDLVADAVGWGQQQATRRRQQTAAGTSFSSVMGNLLGLPAAAPQPAAANPWASMMQGLMAMNGGGGGGGAAATQAASPFGGGGWVSPAQRPAAPTQPSSPLSSLSPSQLSAMGSAMEALGGSLSGLQRAPLGDQRTAVDYVKGVAARVDGTPEAAATAAATPGGAPGLGSLGNIGGALLSALGGGGGM